MAASKTQLARALRGLATDLADAPRLHVHTPEKPFQPLRHSPKKRVNSIPSDATAQELYLARVARQQAEEALANAAAFGIELTVPGMVERRTAAPPPPLPEPPQPEPFPQLVHTAVPPSVEDLFSLWRLCGGSEIHVVETLARLWGCSPLSIADTVRSWLVGMPAIQPPSRSHSAPAVLPLEVRERLKSAAPGGFPTSKQPWERRAAVRRAARLSYDGVSPNPLALNPLKSAGAGRRGGPPRASTAARAAPANSAPVQPSQRMVDLRNDLSSALSGLHSASTRMHGAAKPTGAPNSYHHAREARGRAGAGADRDVYMLPQEPTFQPVMLTAAQVATVPEDAELSFFGDDGGDDALQAFMARNAASIKLNVRDVAKPSDFGSHRMRF